MYQLIFLRDADKLINNIAVLHIFRKYCHHDGLAVKKELDLKPYLSVQMAPLVQYPQMPKGCIF